jgi:hypothetical protein
MVLDLVGARLPEVDDGEFEQVLGANLLGTVGQDSVRQAPLFSAG